MSNIQLYKNFLTKMAADEEASDFGSGSWFDPYSWGDYHSPFRGYSLEEESKESSEESPKRGVRSYGSYGAPKSILGDIEEAATEEEAPKPSKGKRMVFVPYGMPMGGGFHMEMPGGIKMHMGGMPGTGMVPPIARRAIRESVGDTTPEKPAGKGKTEIKRLASGAEVMLVRDGSGRVIDVLDMGKPSGAVDTDIDDTKEEAPKGKKMYTEEDLAARKAEIDRSVGGARRASKEIGAALDAREANRRAWKWYRVRRGLGIGGGAVAGLMASNYIKDRLGWNDPAKRGHLGFVGGKLMDLGIGGTGAFVGGYLANKYLKPRDLSAEDIAPGK